jgi:hypothetical protein
LSFSTVSKIPLVSQPESKAPSHWRSAGAL